MHVKQPESITRKSHVEYPYISVVRTNEYYSYIYIESRMNEHKWSESWPRERQRDEVKCICECACASRYTKRAWKEQLHTHTNKNTAHQRELAHAN